MSNIDYNFFDFAAHLGNELDKVIPVNPLTGLRDDLIHKYEISLTDSERAKIMNYLSTVDVHNPDTSKLSDKELIALCPSRYISTLTDVRQLADAMRVAVGELDSAAAKSVDNSNSIDNGLV